MRAWGGNRSHTALNSLSISAAVAAKLKKTAEKQRGKKQQRSKIKLSAAPHASSSFLFLRLPQYLDPPCLTRTGCLVLYCTRQANHLPGREQRAAYMLRTKMEIVKEDRFIFSGPPFAFSLSPDWMRTGTGTVLSKSIC